MLLQITIKISRLKSQDERMSWYENSYEKETMPEYKDGMSKK